jgi:copper chaperone CopZ
MRVHPNYALVSFLAVAAVGYAVTPGKAADKDAEVVKATYVITGLHCPPCTKTVETSLRKVKGIHSVNVDWSSKNAQIEFDESVLPAQKVARLIADTPHMMGSGMHYDAILVLKVPDIKDEATAKPIEDALSKVAGVGHVVAYPAQHSVGVQFATKGDVTSQQLIDALSKTGVQASVM